jgi:pyrroline-5-carboxylate reductase
MGNNWTLGMIGVGNMGSAIARGVLKAGLLTPDRLYMTDIDSVKIDALAKELGAHACKDEKELVAAADTVLIAVKPQQIGELLGTVAPLATPNHLFISIAAGIPTGKFCDALGAEARIIRVMPNTPAMLGCGAAGVARGGAATDADLARALDLFGSVGVAVEVEESQINAVTGLSGSGPAYVFHLIEALIEAGCAVGLSDDVSRKLTIQTVLGAARMAVETGTDPAELRRRVTSPNGTTEAGLKVMADGNFIDLVKRTVARATERGEELAKLVK